MIDQGITEGNYSLLYGGRRPLSILAELDVSHFPWFERLGSFTAAGYRIQTGICGGSAYTRDIMHRKPPNGHNGHSLPLPAKSTGPALE
jgi:hypothetical protein